MVEKKLLTLVSVVGILACGACFLPPLPRHLPAPPALASVHSIAIHVEDGTGSNLFDPLTISDATAGNFNELWKEYPIRAEAFNAGEPIDAVLKITVLHNTASCNFEGNGKQFCSFEVIASFTLTTADGRTAFQSRPGKSSKFGVWYKGNSLPDNLNANPFRQQASYSLAMTAGEMLFYNGER